MSALKSPTSNHHQEGSGALASLADLIALRHRAMRSALPVNRIATNPMSGQLRSTQQGRGIDFSEVRLYQPGDDIRSIDWKVTARTSKTHTKIFQEERERPVMILLDQGPSLYFGTQVRFKSVAAARLAALLGWVALDQGDRIGELSITDTITGKCAPDATESLCYALFMTALISITSYSTTFKGPKQYL